MPFPSGSNNVLAHFYPNCSCCGSGSASGSASECECWFFNLSKIGSEAGSEGWGYCQNSDPVNADCKKNFVLTIYFNFTNCGSAPIGSCGSGGPASGAETGLVEDGSGSGSGSIPCSTTCPENCCDLIPKSKELYLTCFGNLLTTQNIVTLTETSENVCYDPNGVRFLECKGARPICDYALIGRTWNFDEDGRGVFGIALDSSFIYGFLENPSLDSCNPLLISGTSSFGKGFPDYPSLFSCIYKCFGFLESEVYLDLSCMTATWVITEASTGGGGGGGGPVL